MKLLKWMIPALSLMLAACGSSQSIVKEMESKPDVPLKYRVVEIQDQSGKAVPPHFIAAAKGNLESELTKRSLLAASGSTADVKIIINSYRMRSGFTRGMFGMMAGKDGLGSTVTVIDSRTGKTLGESAVSTYNVMAIGGEEDIARMHASEIAKFIAGEKGSRK